MKKIKHILLFLIIITLLQFTFTSFSSQEQATSNDEEINIDNISSSQIITTNFSTQTSKIDINSPSCILIESSTGKVLYEKNSNEIRYPASTTKIMTAILALEKCNLTDVATVSHNAIYSIPADYVISNLREGEELTIEQLINLLLIPSANDAAIVLAEHISGSVGSFADLMNEKAKEIGCKNTNFVNPNGIHNKNHVSTSYDLALIAKYAMQNSTFRQIVKKTKYTLSATNKYKKDDRIFITTNQLLIKNNSKSNDNYYYPDCIGIKTGYTGEAGNCLVASAKRNDMEVISVVLGAGFTKSGLSEKFLDSITLLDYAFDNYCIQTLNNKNDILQEVKVRGAKKETESLGVTVKDDIKILAETSFNLENLKPNIELEKLKAPISAGSTVGKIAYTCDDKTYTYDLVAMNDVTPSNFLPILLRICLIIITLYLLYLLLNPDKSKDSKKSNEKMKKISKRRSKKARKGGNYRNTFMSHFN